MTAARRVAIVLTEPQFEALHSAYLLQRETWVADEIPDGTVHPSRLTALDNAWMKVRNAWGSGSPAARNE